MEHVTDEQSHAGPGALGTVGRYDVSMPTVRIILLVLLVWNGVLWLVLGGLISPVLPGGWRTALALALLLYLPVLVLAQAFTGNA
jgi:hypothetical protein